MIKATYQMYNEDEAIDEPFEKEFANEQEMRDYDAKQMGHPFLTLKLISPVET